MSKEFYGFDDDDFKIEGELHMKPWQPITWENRRPDHLAWREVDDAQGGIEVLAYNYSFGENLQAFYLERAASICRDSDEYGEGCMVIGCRCSCHQEEPSMTPIPPIPEDLKLDYESANYRGKTNGIQIRALIERIAKLRADNKALLDAAKAHEQADAAWKDGSVAHNVCHELTKRARELTRAAIEHSEPQ